jgi:hypothetical protein
MVGQAHGLSGGRNVKVFMKQRTSAIQLPFEFERR